ncbi:uncharacterized protein LOC110457098 [Mizuhopecten yessoensis]|uniref:uncharacterized protein LOC110457098 n=1 Tax=Mizuhopecten yessoensis TaxID=6573 RepID=UPI000B45D010|nr:uncharacterized protein LOC110457098 [Mizuhopecten yessoensis]
MPHQLPSMGFCIFICALSLIAPSLAGDYAPPPQPEGYAPPSAGYLPPAGTKTKCCDNAILINGRCVCKPNYSGASTHPCDKPCWDKCGRNTYCNVKTFQCNCKTGFIGSPYTDCHLPCYGKCVDNATCNKDTNKCVCNTGLVGNGAVLCHKPSVVVLTKTVYTISESVGQLQVEVLRKGSSVGVLTVTYATTDLTATYGVDYSGNKGVVVFGNGENTKYITFYIISDKKYEQAEKFKVTLLSVSIGGILGTPIEAVITITNDDKPCGSCGPYSHCDVPSQKCVCDDGYILDPYHGYHGGCVKPCGGRCCTNAYCNKQDNRCYCNKGFYGVPTVKCYKPCKDACKINSYCGKYNKCYCNKGFYGNPYDGCHPPCHGHCKINARCDIPSQKCACNDGFYGDPYKICDKPGVVVIASPTYSVVENVGVVVITVTRTGSTYAAVTVKWESRDITALQGSDYIGKYGYIYFASGQTSETISIEITVDLIYEKDETFSVSLTHVTAGAVLGNIFQTIVTIKNDDPPCGGPCKPFSRCDVPSQRCVCIKGYIPNSYGGCSLPCGGKCCANAYCDATDNRCKCRTGYIGIGTWKCSKPCDAACKSYAYCAKDNRCYCSKGYYGSPYKGCHLPCYNLCKANTACDLSNHRCYCKRGYYGNPLKGCSTPGSFSFTKSVYTVKENVGLVHVTIHRKGSSSQGVSVYWKTVEGSAKRVSDFGDTGGILYFASGEIEKTITIHILDDKVYETEESFTVSLTLVSAGGVLGQVVTATITIQDDDDTCGGPCGHYAHCDLRIHKCVCDKGYLLDSYHGGCVPPCGGRCCNNAYCDRGDNTCKCKPGYLGLGTVACYKPCQGACVINAECGPDNKCCCKKGYYGNPYVECTLPCRAQCKRNARCDISSQRCECAHGFYGDPTVGCDKASTFVFAKPSYQVNEDAGTITVTVNRIGSTYGSISVSWVTKDLSAGHPHDFLNSYGVLFFAHGVESRTITIYLFVDKVYEQDENFQIVLTKVTPGGVLGGLTATTVTILNDDKPCGGPCGINAYCDKPTQKCVCNKGFILWHGVCGLPCGGKCCANAYCSTKDNQCYCNRGYIGTPTQKCYIPCNRACKDYAFCGKDNKCHCKTGYYGNPYQTCHLPCHGQCKQNSKCNTTTHQCVCLPGFFGDGKVGCTKPSVFIIAQSSYAVKESVNVLVVNVNRIGSSSGSVKVTWKTTDLTAESGHDYVNTGGVLYFGDKETSKDISIHIIDDKFHEADEQFVITLTEVTQGGVIGLQYKATVTIENDDVPCGGPCGINAFCDKPSQKCLCLKGFVKWNGVCDHPCGGHCPAYPHSHCNYKTNKCECDDNYSGDAYHGGCICTSGGHTGGYGETQTGGDYGSTGGGGGYEAAPDSGY